MRPLIVPLLFLATVLAAGCMEKGPDHDVVPGPQQAAIHTSKGSILISFYCDAAPKTVANFRQYAQDDFYAGTIFHRIIENFMIQGGGFTPDWEQKQTREPVELEYEEPNVRGAVAMARSQDPNSATSQFFINTRDNTDSLGPGANGPGYTVFARVVDGMDVVDELAAVEVKPHRHNQRENSEPVDPPQIEDVTVGAGCNAGSGDEEQEPPSYGVEAGLIQNTQDADGVWHTNISAAKDLVPIYLMNLGNREDTFRATIEQPAGWNVSLSKGVYVLPANTNGEGSQYPYVIAEVLEVQPEGDIETAQDANVTVRFQSENDDDAVAVLRIRLDVTEKTYSRVSMIGDSMSVHYTGSFDDGEVFDTSRQEGRSPLPVDAGGQGTVTGFSYGLLGLHIGERVDIRFPPEIGYGYNQAGNRAQFNGEWLNFDLEVTSLS